MNIWKIGKNLIKRHYLKKKKKKKVFPVIYKIEIKKLR